MEPGGEVVTSKGAGATPDVAQSREATPARDRMRGALIAVAATLIVISASVGGHYLLRQVNYRHLVSEGITLRSVRVEDYGQVSDHNMEKDSPRAYPPASIFVLRGSPFPPVGVQVYVDCPQQEEVVSIGQGQLEVNPTGRMTSGIEASQICHRAASRRKLKVALERFFQSVVRRAESVLGIPILSPTHP